LGKWLVAGTAVMPPGSRRTGLGQRPHPVPMCVLSAVSRGSCDLVLSTPGAMEEGWAVFLDSSSNAGKREADSGAARAQP
jgi:hypothetical protein